MTKSETGFALARFPWRGHAWKFFRHSSFVIRIFISLGLAFTAGCMTVRVPEAKQEKEIAALAGKLSGLSPQVNPAEAQRAAEAAVRYPLQLAREWHATRPAVINNVLINSGIHSRGLCYQWADALTVKLLTLHLQTLEMHRGVAHLGTKHEHSSVVLTAPGQNFTNGIALDAWRHCGRLNFSPVLTDNFPWKEVELIPSYREELGTAAEKLEANSR
jgi:hypothetical protein